MKKTPFGFVMFFYYLSHACPYQAFRHQDLCTCMVTMALPAQHSDRCTLLASLNHFEMHNLHTGLSQFDILCDNSNTRREGTWARDNKEQSNRNLLSERKCSALLDNLAPLATIPMFCLVFYQLSMLFCCCCLVVVYFRKLQ